MTNETFIHGLENALRLGIEALQGSERQLPVSDLFVEIDTDNGAVILYDDNEQPLCKEWMEGLDEWDPEDELLATVRRFFKQESTRELIETLDLAKPFSVLLVDDALNEVEELLLIDNENLLLTTELLEKYDRELNDFLQRLLTDN